MKFRQAHPLPPSYEWDRRDPDYDPIRPVEVLAMVPVAIAVFIAALCIVGFLLAVMVGPEVRG